MKRKRHQQTPARNGTSVPPLRAPRVDNPDAPDESFGAPAVSHTEAYGHVGSMALVAAALLLFVLCVVVGCIVRWRSPPGTWPAVHDIGLSFRLAAVAAVALTFSSCVLEWAGRLQRQGKFVRPQVGLAIVLMLGAVALGVRVQEYRTLHREGIRLWDARRALFNEADVYYVHAVKEQLKQRFEELENKRANRSDTFSSLDQQHFELVTTLQSSMVGWTEQEVGHWLDDTHQRRSLMNVMAYQIHPTARQRESMQDRVEMEKEDLSRRRQWLALLQDVCHERLALIRQRKEDESSSGTALSELSGEGGTSKESKRSDELAKEVRERLQRLGAGDWAFADAVLQDAVDNVMAGERLNQIHMTLANMDARATFVREFLDPLWADPAAPGLNRQFPFLRLPVSFPQARAWTASFILMTGLHSVLLVSGFFALLWRLGRRRMIFPEKGPCPTRWVWHATAAMSLLIFVAFYFV
ncbi:MAG: hypothetical protein ACYC6N_09710 [Pirellulaceae bacterium]